MSFKGKIRRSYLVSGRVDVPIRNKIRRTKVSPVGSLFLCKP